MSTAKKMSLKDWINEIGVEELARLFKVTEATIRHWRRGHCLPRSAQLAKILKYSRGRVSLDEILNSVSK